ncbi:chloride channel protein [Geobacter sp. AOG1]|uniref:chloride channel protein n=1 Tax=Geobacter sp. AOG1 TaxID=1566346 RepID=UPI001CC445A2|nr:chloride channel protein [Geobacter sp. AOG1]
MQRKLFEQITLIASVIKWTTYATIVGVLVGCGTTVFLTTLTWTSSQAGRYPWHYYFLPLTFAVSSFLVAWLAPEAEGHGTEKVIEAVHKRMGRIPFKVVPVKLLATVITLAGGGSAGKEGPCAQIGAGLASSFANLLRLDDVDRRKLVICGISAGFATVFGTPVAGALFGVEVLVLGQMFYDVLFPSFVAGIVGYHVTTNLGVQYAHAPLCIPPQMTGWSMAEIILLGVWCGLIALFFIEMMKLSHRSFVRFFKSRLLRGVVGGGMLVLIAVFASPAYLGLGLDTLDAGWKGTVLPTGAFFWKSITTSITLGCGGSGGVVTPIFFIGTTAGNLFAHLFNPQYIASYSAIGMVALLAGAANTPIAASVMAIELFGPALGPHAAVACMVSFLVVGYRSIYPSQVLGIQKSASLPVVTGKPVGESDAAVVFFREKSLIGMISKMLRVIWKGKEK